MNRKPNIIYILADDMGYGDVSALNENAAFQTPNFDAMCRDGICFTDAHSTSAVCTPSRYGILTGRYNWRSGQKKGVLGGYGVPLIENGRKTIADILRQDGYKTCAIGKWHLGMEYTYKDGTAGFDNVGEYNPDWKPEEEDIDFTKQIINSPLDHGFDYFYGITASLDMPPYVYIENNRFTEVPTFYTENDGSDGKKMYWRKGLTGEHFKHEEALPNFTKKVLEKIEEYRDEPFFIYFPMNAPHTPILPTKEFQGKSGTNEYGDFVLMCDDIVGQIVGKLKELGLYENTMVVFTSDNGCSPWADFETLATFGHNPSYIFRGMKTDIFEGGHRIPLMVTYPALVKGGLVADQTVCLCDFAATAADLLGIKLEDNEAEDSFSCMPLLRGEKKNVRSSTVHHSVNGSLSIRKGKYKLEMCPGSGGWSHPTPQEKLPEDAPKFQLYDLEKDIGETTNIIREHEDVFRELKAELAAIVKNGRSTPGKPQKNTLGSMWNAVQWMENEE